jgi:hypothetical protein
MKLLNKKLPGLIATLFLGVAIVGVSPFAQSVYAAPVDGSQNGPVQSEDADKTKDDADKAADSSSASSVSQGADDARGSGQPADLFGKGSIFVAIINTLLFVIGAVAVVMLVYGGIRYTISGGDQASVTAAKNTILYAVIGIIVAVMAYAIVNFVLTAITKGTTKESRASSYSLIV